MSMDRDFEAVKDAPLQTSDSQYFEHDSLALKKRVGNKVALLILNREDVAGLVASINSCFHTKYASSDDAG